MIGLNIDGKPVLRAYSIASPNWHEEFEFVSSIGLPPIQTGTILDHLHFSRKHVLLIITLHHLFFEFFDAEIA